MTSYDNTSYILTTNQNAAVIDSDETQYVINLNFSTNKTKIIKISNIFVNFFC